MACLHEWMLNSRSPLIRPVPPFSSPAVNSMHSYKTTLSIAVLAIVVVACVANRPSAAEKGGRNSPDDAELSQRVHELEQRVSDLETIVRPEREAEAQAELIEVMDDAYRNLAMELVRISRAYADAVSEDASPDELAAQKRLLLRHCELLEKIAEKREHVSKEH